MAVVFIGLNTPARYIWPRIVSSLQSYEEWKAALPDSKFLHDLLPSVENIDKFRTDLISFKDKIIESVPDFQLGKQG